MEILKSLGVAFNATLLALLLATSHGILKWVADQGEETLFETIIRHWFTILVALAIYGFIFLYYLVMLKAFELASLYGIYTGLAVVFVVLISVLFFKEQLDYWQIAGCALIAFGVALVGRA